MIQFKLELTINDKSKTYLDIYPIGPIVFKCTKTVLRVRVCGHRADRQYKI